MNTRKLADHYEINKHYLTQDINNALALIVDNIDMLSDDQIKKLRVAMDDRIMRRYTLNHTPGHGYQPITDPYAPRNPQPPKSR